MTVCTVCGGREFRNQAILWDSLIAEWQLTPFEAQYVNRQQGTCCTACGANLRSIALADAIRNALCSQLLLSDLTVARETANIAILEINEAGKLTPVLKKFPKHVFATYPQIDIHKMPFHEGCFDIVVHSDTLEHVDHPVHALVECRRILKPGGWLCYTVPIIVGRLSRTRAGLARSYHGASSTRTDDLIVRTEYGADAWVQVMEAGFTNVTIHATEYPSALALSAQKRV